MARYPNNWQYKTLEILENEVWNDTDIFPSGLVIRCHSLRKKPLNEFDNDELRTMISQQIGLFYLIPVAVEVLKKDLYAEGLNPCDILAGILNIDVTFWKENPELWKQVDELIDRRRGSINQKGISAKKFNNALKA